MAIKKVSIIRVSRVNRRIWIRRQRRGGRQRLYKYNNNNNITLMVYYNIEIRVYIILHYNL